MHFPEKTALAIYNLQFANQERVAILMDKERNKLKFEKVIKQKSVYKEDSSLCRAQP